MNKKIVINPLTRISGFMEIDVYIENNRVVDAKTKGHLFRGFEQMLVGRSPFDAVYFTQRICGICSAAHSIASSLALEDALNIHPLEQGRYLRDIIHCCEFLQNHVRHFYQYTVPDYVKLESNSLFNTDHHDFRLPKQINDRISRHYFESLEYSRLAHQMLAILGGKAPHNHGVFIGGITTQATAENVVKLDDSLQKISRFINDKMIPDAYDIAAYYSDYYRLGGGYGNLLTYGAFNNYKDLGTLYVDPLISKMNANNNLVEPFQEKNIKEKIDYSWYKASNAAYRPDSEMAEPDMEMNEKAYSWVKAPRYEGLPFEVGPLARLILSGEYQNGISAMDRTLARALEAKKICEIMKELLHSVIPNVDLQKAYEIPEQASGRGLVDTIRGALGHWLKVENKKISFYQIITPSTWDFSTKDDLGYRGVAEEALIGTPINDPNNPAEVGRILRSFDPCMSCATHVYSPGKQMKTIKVF
ncbi:[Ni/Fe] hydrogenase, large subunit [Alkalihalophilus pseudofirmus OF4]|uniref:[Ni/Fe] hydrogenase, large subunit n=1 Tax=Alkalihalophilus pseudofirmus (strain ATCC BAA-2126 / JCM 17055 / OF4) TaxID=398511 RepID=D3FUC5_ALKPO|nr:MULTISPECIES: nickel-dependent hydrogenase large subunit [Alkalihalophilus]ADC48327.1 [Ni/Fe] hydrogenase, large subunit [Alkalihalophilus pseudofirmus OF4]MED1601171.1 nickel-dependent hydrogenase large subunit [Alkalihalophilus marmarensis]